MLPSFRISGAFLIALLAAGGLAGCVQTAAVAPSTESSAAADAVWTTVTRNADRLGASSLRATTSQGVVTYSGAPRDFISCSARSASAVPTLALDSRSTVTVLGGVPTVETLYVLTATDGAGGKTSVAFDSGSPGRFDNGVTCRSTGALERRLLG